MLTEREELIVRWLRRQAKPDPLGFMSVNMAAAVIDRVADAIERGAHLQRPAPTVPASVWTKESNLTDG